MGIRMGERKMENQRVAELVQSYETACQQSIESRTVMQEIFSRPSNEAKPVSEQEFAELRIDDWTDTLKPGFAVTEWRIRWSEADQRFTWEDEQREHWSAFQTATNRYEVRRVALIDQGFTHSDMDF